MGLDYDYPAREKACASQPLKVKLDKKHVGEIRKVKDGYQYYPKGEKKGGEVFPRVSEVQNSLLGIQRTRKDKKQDPVGDDSEVTEELSDNLKKARKKIDTLEEFAKRSTVLLTAVVDLLEIQKESKTDVNLLEESVNYDDTECDGHSLIEDIAKHIEL